MIGSLRGVLLERTPEGQVLIEVGGVGYLVQVPASAVAALGELGGPVFLHVHTHVREDALVLYGFASRDERRCFEVLIGAHGVGPALALALLSIHSPAALRRVVAAGDADALTLVPGIGKKTAARLLLELAPRLSPIDADLELVEPGGPSSGGQALHDVRAALANLGYGAEEVRAAVRDLPGDASSEELLRRALRQLAAAR